jgi:predicted chitinase
VSVEAFFDAARALKREMADEGLTQVEVDAFKSIIETWHRAAPVNPTALSDEGAFFASVRQSFGSLTQSQVQGFQRLLQAFGVAHWPIAFAAYGLATAWHETSAQMQPVEEAYFLGTKAADYRKKLPYFPWYGRGDVQLTWRANYARADDDLDLHGALLADPDKALDPLISARVMVKGMEGGWFTGKSLADYLPGAGPADIHQLSNARQIINGLDRAVEIGGHALKFQDALEAGGWR